MPAVTGCRVDGYEAQAPAIASLLPKAVASFNSGKRVPTRRERRHTRAKALDKLAVVGGTINTPPLPKNAIAYIATFLIHATLPYKDPGDVDLWTRGSDKYTVTFERGYTPPDRDGCQRKVGLPYGIYPRLIFSWMTTQAALTRSPDLSFGNTFTDWIRHGLHVRLLGGCAVPSLLSASR